MSEKQGALLCEPVTHLQNAITGSTQSKCEICSTAVWVSPSSRPLIMEHKLMIACPPCCEALMAKEVAEGLKPEFEQLTPEQMKELNEAFSGRV